MLELILEAHYGLHNQNGLSKHISLPIPARPRPHRTLVPGERLLPGLRIRGTGTDAQQRDNG